VTLEKDPAQNERKPGKDGRVKGNGRDGDPGGGPTASKWSYGFHASQLGSRRRKKTQQEGDKTKLRGHKDSPTGVCPSAEGWKTGRTQDGGENNS